MSVVLHALTPNMAPIAATRVNPLCLGSFLDNFATLPVLPGGPSRVTGSSQASQTTDWTVTS